MFLALALSRLFPRREMAMQVLLFTSLPSVFRVGFAWLAEHGASAREAGSGRVVRPNL